MIAFYDIETKYNPNHAGWNDYEAMGISAIAVQKIANNMVLRETFDLDSLHEMVKYIGNPKHLIGFNNNRFDDNLLYHFLNKQEKISEEDTSFMLKSFDILSSLENVTGIKYVTNLDDLCQATIGEGKGEIDGSMVPELYERGEIEKIKEYCQDDVNVMRKTFMFGAKYGYVLIPPNKGDMFGDLYLKIEVNWSELI